MIETGGNDRLRVPALAVYIAVALIGWGLSAYIGYAAAVNAMNARVSVLEARSLEVDRRLASIEAKIDQLLLRNR